MSSCAALAVSVDERGTERLLAVEDGARESADSWSEVLLNLKDRGMDAPKLAVGDGVLGGPGPGLSGNTPGIAASIAVLP